MSINKFALLFFASLLVLSCAKETPSEPEYTWTLPEVLIDYSIETPEVLPAFLVDTYFDQNSLLGYELSNEAIALGRVLFYDQRLSDDNTISCASCHQQANAFSSDVAFSEGIDGQLTPRNSMSLVNLRWNRFLFWDQRESSLDSQVLQPIVHPEEMNSDLAQLIIELSQIEGYPALFESAFDSPEITEEGISSALAQFIRAITSFDTKYDEGRLIDYTNYSSAELRGKDVFFNNRCNQCHTGQSFFQAGDPRNNGLDSDPVDLGFYNVSGNENDIGKFKTMTLRNIEYTAPYMHDGRFKTLMEVVEFYNSGVQAHPNLDDRLTEEIEIGGTPIRLNFTQQQKEDLVAFLGTLSDESLLNDEKFSNPFPR